MLIANCLTAFLAKTGNVTEVGIGEKFKLGINSGRRLLVKVLLTAQNSFALGVVFKEILIHKRI